MSDWSGKDVSLVARGYLPASAQGQGYQIRNSDGSLISPSSLTGTGLSYTLYTSVGIYYAHSTNGGVSWSGWTPLEDLTTQLTTIVQSGTYYTVDHPRIAFRRDYGDWVNDVPGCITWERRQFTISNNGYENYFASSSIHTWIGMRFYQDGTIYAAGTGGNYPALNSATNPQRPSLAISPDGGLWLAYYTVASGDWNTTAQASYYVQRGSVSLSGSPITATVTFSSSDKQIVASTSDASGGADAILPGYYDQYRGYFFSEEGQIYPDFDAEFAQGPQIQVAVNNVYQCQPSYSVGFVYTYAQQHNQAYADQINGSYAQVSRWLSFWQATVPFGGVPENVHWYNQDKALNGYAGSGGSSYEMFLFPVLKYTLDNQITHSFSDPANNVEFRFASYFLLSAIQGQRCTGPGMGGNTLDWAYCLADISYDNGTNLSNSVPAFDMDDVASAQPQTCGGVENARVQLENIGTQIDVNGGQTDLEVHSAWHQIAIIGNGGSCESEQLYENNGGSIIVNRYLDGYPYNDNNIAPDAGNEIYQLQLAGINNPMAGHDPYHYFNYDNFNQPEAKNGVPGITIPSSIAGFNYQSPPNTEIDVGLGNFQFNTFQPAIPSSGFVPYGEYWADYVGTEKNNYYGTLGTSDQRKLVMTEDIAHAVFEDADTVFYSEGIPNPNNSRTWTQPLAIGKAPGPGIVQTKPSIAVYEEDALDSIRTLEEQLGATPLSQLPAGVDRYNGLSAIAVTWTELDESGGGISAPATIKIRTREFNACTGDWEPWGPIQTVYAGSPDEYVYGDGDYPVSTVAPLAWPKGHIDPQTHQLTYAYPTDPYIRDPALGHGDAFTFQPTNLIGWVTTWADMDANYYPGQAYIRSDVLLRASQDNSGWGTTYPSMTLVPSTAPNYYTLYENDLVWLDRDDWHYVSSTTAENKATDSLAEKLQNPGPLSPGSPQLLPNYRIDLAFSTDVADVTAGSAQYSPDVAYGPLGALLGTDLGTPVFKPQHYLPGDPPSYLRDPEITVNSSGQEFLAWEQTQDLNPYVNLANWNPSIEVATTNYAPLVGNPQAPPQWNTTLVTVFSEPTPLLDGRNGLPFWWVTNPSIAGLPKTMLPNTSDAYDADLGEVELMLWQQNDEFGNPVNQLREWDYLEDIESPGAGTWGEIPFSGTGTNPQTSFSTFSAYSPSSLMMGNGNSPAAQNQFSTVEQGSAKIGVFDSIQDYAEYRSEARTNDSAEAKFIWGDAYVTEPGDTTGEQIKLGFGIDTAGWSSSTEIRDSIFRTQPFELDLGATVSYFRGAYTVAHDSLAAATSIGPQQMLQYVVELVHSNGQVDTLERLTYDPALHDTIAPAIITTQASLLPTDTVYLRVEGSVQGFAEADSLFRFGNVICFGHYPAVDSTLARKQATFPSPATDGLQVLDAYPNPLLAPGTRTTVLFSCPKGLTASIELAGTTGNMIGQPKSIVGTGRWQSYSITAPQAAGNYFIRVSDGIDSKVLPLSVIR